jgi:hypothetical protein
MSRGFLKNFPAIKSPGGSTPGESKKKGITREFAGSNPVIPTRDKPVSPVKSRACGFLNFPGEGRGRLRMVPLKPACFLGLPEGKTWCVRQKFRQTETEI